MAITQLGNFTFAGNYLEGDNWEPNDLLTCIRTALGSNDRANIRRTSATNWRIDLRFNNAEENLTGAVAVPASTYFRNFDGQGNTLAANSRFGISMDNSVSLAGGFSSAAYLLGNGDGFINGIYPVQERPMPAFSASAKYHALCTAKSCSIFVKDGTTSAFLSVGLLENSALAFPNNRYGIAVRNTGAPRITFHGASNVLVPLYRDSATGNYIHTKLSDSQPTEAEVELVARRLSDTAQIGIVPIFKIKIDGTATAPAIGDTIIIRVLENTRDLYEGLTNIFAIIVGRLGNASPTDAGGDYLAMYVAGDV